MSGDGPKRRSRGSRPSQGARPTRPTSLMAYAVHTRGCTYLLDDAGICHWIVSPTGVVPPHVRQCIGAQFVASLSLETPGGLAADLRPGSCALLVRHTGDRLVLLRTGPILRVEDQREADDPSDDAPTPLPPRRGVPVAAQSFGRPCIESHGDEQTISVSYPNGPRRS